MILRILNEGQYVVEDDALPRLNELDAVIEAAVAAGDQEALTAALADMFDHVRAVGQLVPDDILADSNLILPDVDATVDEVKAWLDEASTDEGLIPNS
ncbi:MAG TPA: hypothetical protein PKN27_01730 [Propionibacteriaceae bacterium]|nr:hypothetical protein [Propionibacteriaceae bacterium]